MARIGKCVCVPCHITHGIGGAGLFSSGIINLRPDIGGDLQEILNSWNSASLLIDYIDNVFLKFGAPQDRVFEPKGPTFEEYQRSLARVGAQLVPIRQRHIGTDGSTRVIENFVSYLTEAGIKFAIGTAVEHVEKSNGHFILKTRRGIIELRP